MRICF